MNATQKLADAIKAWKEFLGEDGVKHDRDSLSPYSQNITEYEAKRILAVLKPQSVAQLQKAVSVASEAQVPLFVFSTGKNWGLGSKLPISHDVALLDLSGLNAIRAVDEACRYAIIEPGVTQKQLSDYLALHHEGLLLPMTGSGNGTSVIGNLLQRGVTFVHSRNEMVFGYEIMMPDGSLMHTGYWAYDQLQGTKPNFCHGYGIGPDIRGLFAQSNLGIVTAVAIRLLPKLSRGTIAYFNISDDMLGRAVDALGNLQDYGVLHPFSLVTYQNDPRTAVDNDYNYSGQWIVISVLNGTDKMRQVGREEVLQAIAPYASSPVGFVETDEPSEAIHPYFPVLQDLFVGKPSDYSLITMAKLAGVDHANVEIDADKDIPGFSVVLVAVPTVGDMVARAVAQVRAVGERLGVVPFLNFGNMSRTAFEGYFRVYFDRKDPSQIAKAHQWNRETHEVLFSMGIYPYRMNVEQMEAFMEKETGQSKLLSTIKSIIDPKQLISPGCFVK